MGVPLGEELGGGGSGPQVDPKMLYRGGNCSMYAH